MNGRTGQSIDSFGLKDKVKKQKLVLMTVNLTSFPGLEYKNSFVPPVATTVNINLSKNDLGNMIWQT